ncbi:MAG: hypothetical protein HZB46_01760 [Solirubrobacterales bacterium]|nr:hypothetical protein [Solirubrobacterales bacterium]
MRRALAPGGRAAIATWAGRERQPHFDAIATALREHVGEEAADARRHRATPEGGVACDMTALVALAT